MRPRLVGLLSLVVASLLPSPFAPGASVALGDARPSRSIFRIDLPPGADLKPLLRLGLDVAGTGPGGSLDVIMTRAEEAQVRALGFRADPIDLTPRGPHGAPMSPAIPPGLGDYHTYAEAHAEMASYVATYPSIAALDTIGFSIQGRAIEAVKISDNVAVQEPEAEALVVGCHHARELMSVELPLYLMRRLLDGYGADPVVTSLVNERQIWIVPILNPDGYVYVEQHTGGQSDTWWRKNRRANADGSFGVDLNRNYGYLWGFDNFGSSPTPSSEVYRGTGPFSEPETAAFRDFVAAHEFTVSASFHSYGNLVLYPWGYEPSDTPDHPVFKALGDSLAIQNGYLAGNPASGAIYVTNGDLDDWVYGDTFAKPRLFGFTFEVNTADDGGFAPPDGLIGPTCDENWGPLLTLLRYGDEPRRVLPPSRPGRPAAYLDPVNGYRLHWGYPTLDPANPPARHEVREIASLAVVTDDAESGSSDWDLSLFTVSTARSATATRSYASGSGASRTSVLTGRVPVDVAAADSVVVNAFWDLEPNHDYWYAEASADGGAAWTTLRGDRTTDVNPFGFNFGNGVTGSSGGLFLRAAFSLAPFVNQDVLLRFRCITDVAVQGEGLYLDDLSPVVREAGITVHDTGSPDSGYFLPSVPPGVAHYQVRPVDSEGQSGPWSMRLLLEPGVTAVEAGANAPSADRLGEVAPNPFNPSMRVRFALGRGAAGPYRLDLFDLAGRHVACLGKGWDPGHGASLASSWDGRTASGEPAGSGVYLLRLTTARGSTSRKATLLR